MPNNNPIQITSVMGQIMNLNQDVVDLQIRKREVMNDQMFKNFAENPDSLIAELQVKCSEKHLLVLNLIKETKKELGLMHKLVIELREQTGKSGNGK